MRCCNSLTDACLPQRTVPVQHVHKAASKLKYLNLTHHTDITGATWHKVQHGALELGQTELFSASKSNTGTSISTVATKHNSGSSKGVLRFTHCEYAQLHEVCLDGCSALTDKGVKGLLAAAPDLHTLSLKGCLKVTRAAVVKAVASRPHIEVLPVNTTDTSSKDSKLLRTTAAAAAAAKHATSTVVPVEGIQPTSGYNKYMRRVTDERRRHQELHSTVVIGRIWRQHTVRRNAKRHAAACAIQRGLKACAFRGGSTDADRHNFLAIRAAAVTLQRALRKWALHRRVTLAIHLQRLWRGHCTRAHLKHLKRIHNVRPNTIQTSLNYGCTHCVTGDAQERSRCTTSSTLRSVCTHLECPHAAAGVQAVWRAYSIRQAISMQSKISTFKAARRVLGNSCFRTEVRHGKVQEPIGAVMREQMAVASAYIKAELQKEPVAAVSTVIPPDVTSVKSATGKTVTLPNWNRIALAGPFDAAPYARDSRGKLIHFGGLSEAQCHLLQQYGCYCHYRAHCVSSDTIECVCKQQRTQLVVSALRSATAAIRRAHHSALLPHDDVTVNPGNGIQQSIAQCTYSSY
eukprot:14887-Heterococcus_DN1.PRE.3